MYLDTALFSIGLASLLAFGGFAYCFKMTQRTQAGIIIAMLAVYLYLYLFGLDQYRNQQFQRALHSYLQESKCAEYLGQIKFNFSRKKSYESAFQFKTAAYQYIKFNNDSAVQTHLPELSALQIGQRYCLQYATDIPDWNGHWYITALHKEHMLDAQP